MPRFTATGLLIGLMCVSSANCGAVSVQTPKQNVKSPEMTPPPRQTLTLTNEQPSKAFSLKLPARPLEAIEVSVSNVNNPARTPVDISVYLLSEPEKDKTKSARILLGNFSLYPADRGGKFLLNPSPAARKLIEQKSSKNEPVQAFFEMKRVDEKKPWTKVDLTISQLEWRDGS